MTEGWGRVITWEGSSGARHRHRAKAVALWRAGRPQKREVAAGAVFYGFPPAPGFSAAPSMACNSLESGLGLAFFAIIMSEGRTFSP